jgi:hypothetical protein
MPKKLKDDRNQFGTSTQLHVMVHLTVPKAVHDAVLRLHNRQNSSTTKTNSDSAGAIVQEISSPLSMLQSNAAHRTVSRRYATTLRSSQVAPRQQYWRRARSIEHNAAFANAAYSPRTGTLLATGRQRKICGAADLVDWTRWSVAGRGRVFELLTLRSNRSGNRYRKSAGSPCKNGKTWSQPTREIPLWRARRQAAGIVQVEAAPMTDSEAVERDATLRITSERQFQRSVELRNQQCSAAKPILAAGLTGREEFAASLSIRHCTAAMKKPAWIRPTMNAGELPQQCLLHHWRLDVAAATGRLQSADDVRPYR